MKKIAKVLLYAIVAPMLAFGIVAVYIWATTAFEANGTAVPLPTLVPMPTPHPFDALTLLSLINDYRESQGLSRLLYDDRLCPFAKKRLSQVHSDWSHSGYRAEVLKTYCIHCTWSGENLGKGYLSEQEELDAWLASPEHKENIEKAAYTNTCIVSDVANDNGAPSNFTVQEFSSAF